MSRHGHVIEVVETGTPEARSYRATMALGARRYADASRIARAFTELVVSVAENPTGTTHGCVTKTTDPAGNSVIEFRCPVLGISSVLISGYLEPILEDYAGARLESGRFLEADEDLVIRVDVSILRSAEGETVLRVALPSGGSLEGPQSDSLQPPSSVVEPRGPDSGIHFRGAGLLDVEEALEFAVWRSS